MPYKIQQLQYKYSKFNTLLKFRLLNNYIKLRAKQ